MAVTDNEQVRIDAAEPGKADEAEFVMLADTQVHFDGNLAALRTSADPYLKTFLS